MTAADEPTSTSQSRSADHPWRVHFVELATERGAEVPTRDFLDALPIAVAAEVHSVLDLACSQPPPMAPLGRRWSPLQGALGDVWCVRVAEGDRNHRLWCVLDDPGRDLGGPSIVCLGGASKAVHAPTPPHVLARVAAWRDDFYARHAVAT